jgi:hypothetical protein
MDLPMGFYHRHADFRAARSPGGVGAAVVEYRVDEAGTHRWCCVASDGTRRRYVDVRSTEFGRWERVMPLVVEAAVERFAASLPEPFRLYHLVNTNPIHLTRAGQAVD